MTQSDSELHPRATALVPVLTCINQDVMEVWMIDKQRGLKAGE